MISLIIPTCGGNIENFKRTASSANGVCNDVVAISTCLFEDDLEAVRQATSNVVELPWNYTFMNGFGAMHNRCLPAAKNDWMILLGVGETIHSGHETIRNTLVRANENSAHQCWHVNDPNRWTRVWSRKGNSRWGGIIHECIRGGHDAGVLFEMRDTDKVPCADPLKNECLKYFKTCLYNKLYQRLLLNPELLGYTDPGWLNFVEGAKESINAFCKEHEDLILAAVEGNKADFIEGVSRRMEASKPAVGVNFNPQGQPTSGNETITMQCGES